MHLDRPDGPDSADDDHRAAHGSNRRRGGQLGPGQREAGFGLRAPRHCRSQNFDIVRAGTTSCPKSTPRPIRRRSSIRLVANEELQPAPQTFTVTLSSPTAGTNTLSFQRVDASVNSFGAEYAATLNLPAGADADYADEVTAPSCSGNLCGTFSAQSSASRHGRKSREHQQLSQHADPSAQYQPNDQHSARPGQLRPQPRQRFPSR